MLHFFFSLSASWFLLGFFGSSRISSVPSDPQNRRFHRISTGEKQGSAPFESGLFLPPGGFRPAEYNGRGPSRLFLWTPGTGISRHFDRQKTGVSVPFESGLFCPREFFGPQNTADAKKPPLSARTSRLDAALRFAQRGAKNGRPSRLVNRKNIAIARCFADAARRRAALARESQKRGRRH